MFESNVRLYTDKLRNQINGIKHDHVDSCIEDVLKTKTFIGGKGYHYICLTCVRHMKRGKVPPMSAMNRFQLHEEDKEIKHQKLDLTELEGALIAKNIIFQKIYQLPKSRWTALKDRLINIPIMDEDIMNTIEQMPRTPQEAGLIGVALKRKKEYVCFIISFLENLFIIVSVIFFFFIPVFDTVILQGIVNIVSIIHIFLCVLFHDYIHLSIHQHLHVPVPVIVHISINRCVLVNSPASVHYTVMVVVPDTPPPSIAVSLSTAHSCHCQVLHCAGLTRCKASAEEAKILNRSINTGAIGRASTTHTLSFLQNLTPLTGNHWDCP